MGSWTGKWNRWSGAISCVALLAGCAAMTRHAPKPVRDLNLPALIKDPAWINGDCKSELHRRGVIGLCAVVTLARKGRPVNPAEATRSALAQGKEQLADTTRQLLLDAIDTCQAHCGIPDGPPRLDIAGRLARSAVEGARVLDTWLAGDDNYYGMVAIDLGAFTRAINGSTDLAQEARAELCNRARESLQ